MEYHLKKSFQDWSKKGLLECKGKIIFFNTLKNLKKKIIIFHTHTACGEITIRESALNTGNSI